MALSNAARSDGASAVMAEALSESRIETVPALLVQTPSESQQDTVPAVVVDNPTNAANASVPTNAVEMPSDARNTTGPDAIATPSNFARNTNRRQSQQPIVAVSENLVATLTVWRGDDTKQRRNRIVEAEPESIAFNLNQG